jgi:hypothetical protein
VWGVGGWLGGVGGSGKRGGGSSAPVRSVDLGGERRDDLLREGAHALPELRELARLAGVGGGRGGRVARAARGGGARGAAARRAHGEPREHPGRRLRGAVREGERRRNGERGPVRAGPEGLRKASSQQLLACGGRAAIQQCLACGFVAYRFAPRGSSQLHNECSAGALRRAPSRVSGALRPSSAKSSASSAGHAARASAATPASPSCVRRRISRWRRSHRRLASRRTPPRPRSRRGRSAWARWPRRAP